MSHRYLHPVFQDHFKNFRQIIFLTGPRQVGKTTLAQSLLEKVIPGKNYFNWDAPDQRRILLTQVFKGIFPFSEDSSPVVFDEIHKYPRWKNTLKGLFDTQTIPPRWIVTGSALLNVYRRGQDSLLGRHFTYHLCPFSVAELTSQKNEEKFQNDFLIELKKPNAASQEALEQLLQFGGFPEPLFKGSATFLRQWRRNRLDRLVHQDLASTENLRNLPLVEQLMTLLPDRIGSPLSLNNLREDLEVHYATIKHWMHLLERVFYGFYLPPFSKKATRLLKKEPKWYLWDGSEIEDVGARFENLVAVHLLKYVHYQNDLGLDDLSLHYVRDKEKREVDFLVCRKRKPLFLVECKNSRQTLSPALKDLAKLLEVKVSYQIDPENLEGKRFEEKPHLFYLLPAASFLEKLI